MLSDMLETTTLGHEMELLIEGKAVKAMENEIPEMCSCGLEKQERVE